MPLELLRPVWGAPPQVRAAMSTRRGGGGAPPFDTLSLHGGGADSVAENRRCFAEALGATPRWLSQVHGAAVVRLTAGDGCGPAPEADAGVTTEPGLGCVVLVADCLPVLMCSADGRAVAAAHAGWRGLAAGVLENTLAALQQAAGCDAGDVHAWLGPCIGPRMFEVGADVLQAFGTDPCQVSTPGFLRRDRADGSRRWLADLPRLARARLHAAGVHHVSGGHWCTVEDASRFFSFRRDGLSGRMAAGVTIAG